MQTSKQASSTPRIIAGIVTILVCCSCAAIVGAAALFVPAFREVNLTPFSSPFGSPVPPTPVAQVERPPVESVPLDTLQVLMETDLPENDPYDLACRLQSVCNVPA